MPPPRSTYVEPESGANPGFPLGEASTPLGGRQPPTWALFGENMCQNERIGSGSGRTPAAPPGSTNENIYNHSISLCQAYGNYNIYLENINNTNVEMMVLF